MILKNLQIVKQEVVTRSNYSIDYVWQRRKKIGFYLLLFFLFWKKDIGWEISLPDSSFSTVLTEKKAGAESLSIFASQVSRSLLSVEESEPEFVVKTSKEPLWKEAQPSKLKAEMWDNFEKPAVKPKKVSYNISPASKKDGNLANDFSNLTFKADKPAFTEAERASTAKRAKQLKYIKRFAETAQKEMKKYGIPASITLAQGLLESNVGESRLARKNNNHFGIKCFSRKCKPGHCSNFTDDSHKDFFRKYKSAWESFRAHSKLLQAKRYRKLYDLDAQDYKGWAHGLKKAGYATDKKYAPKIIQLIEDLDLQQYDR